VRFGGQLSIGLVIGWSADEHDALGTDIRTGDFVGCSTEQGRAVSTRDPSLRSRRWFTVDGAGRWSERRTDQLQLGLGVFDGRGWLHGRAGFDTARESWLADLGTQLLDRRRQIDAPGNHVGSCARPGEFPDRAASACARGDPSPRTRDHFLPHIERVARIEHPAKSDPRRRKRAR
jgi:hypothetical protein